MREAILKTIMSIAIAKLVNGNVREDKEHYNIHVKLTEKESIFFKEHISSLYIFDGIEISLGRKILSFNCSYHYFSNLKSLKVYFVQSCLKHGLSLFDLDYDSKGINGYVSNKLIETEIREKRFDEVFESKNLYYFESLDNGYKTKFSVRNCNNEQLSFIDYSSEKSFNILKFVAKTKEFTNKEKAA